MKPNVIVALLLGLVIGFTVGLLVRPPAAPAVGDHEHAQAPQGARPPPKIDPAVWKVPVEGSPVLGDPDALITMVEFSDYQCPYCSRANVVVEQLREQYGSKLRVVMKNLPLDRLHPNARPAALAALAAGEQGKYWEMHAKLFQNQGSLDDASLQGFARQIGLDMLKWDADRKDARLTKKIQDDSKLAASLGISGTPGFFINGRKIPGALPKDVFETVINEELAKAQAQLAKGVPASQIYAKVLEVGKEPPPPPPPTYAKVAIPADAPALGPKNAKVTIVEWSDFQCPFCSRAAPIVHQIAQQYPNDVRIIFRNQPLTSIHANAQLAAEAALAAHAQGKFWPMHDKLFANQGALDRASIERYAQEIGLNMDKFRKALDTGAMKARVAQDSQDGRAVGAGGTPTFFFNGRMQVGADFATFKELIDGEIAKADKLLASGVKPEQLYDETMKAIGQPQPAPGR
jgi:protein-disulfide isomerase